MGTICEGRSERIDWVERGKCFKIILWMAFWIMGLLVMMKECAVIGKKAEAASFRVVKQDKKGTMSKGVSKRDKRKD
jgi:hypothetical protein